MEILFVLIPIALVLAGVAFATFCWAVRNNQFDDLDSAAHRILFDEDEDMIPEDCRPPRSEPGQPREP